MKNNFYSLLIAIILISIFIMSFIYSKDIYDSVIFSISIWKDNLLPNLFPFFLLSDILIEYGIIDIISIFFGKIISKVFNLPKESSYILITSMISGFPSGSKYIKDLWEKKIIDLKSANHLIMFTHFSNPTFVISTIGVLLLNSKKLGFIILICHIISNLIIGILFKEKTNGRLPKENR